MNQASATRSRVEKGDIEPCCLVARQSTTLVFSQAVWASALQLRDCRLCIGPYRMPEQISPGSAPMINAAVVGLGRWGKAIVEAVQGKSRRLRIIRGITKEPELVPGGEIAHQLALSTEFAEAVADPRVQAVLLATPHSLHVDQIMAVAAAGKPIWCEKPLALTRVEAERAIPAASR
ncbi:MAG: hypothetical protein F9K43_16590, partial [Bauldia sp.]